MVGFSCNDGVASTPVGPHVVAELSRAARIFDKSPYLLYMSTFRWHIWIWKNDRQREEEEEEEEKQLPTSRVIHPPPVLPSFSFSFSLFFYFLLFVAWVDRSGITKWMRWQKPMNRRTAHPPPPFPHRFKAPPTNNPKRRFISSNQKVYDLLKRRRRFELIKKKSVWILRVVFRFFFFSF